MNGSASSVSSTASPRRARVFELIAGHPLLDLVNTLDWRFRDGNPEELLETYSDLLRFCQQSGLLTSSQSRRLLRKPSDVHATKLLAAVKDLREAAAEILYASLEGRDPTPVSMKTMETRFKSAREHQRLLWSDSHLVWDWPNSTTIPEMPLWQLSLIAADLMTSDEFHKVRGCGNPECRWLFLDTSKNHTRRWCDMKICGNRMKARRFKAQHR
jgi:predicted RNA-binding Zn ribbon-like protein